MKTIITNQAISTTALSIITSGLQINLSQHYKKTRDGISSLEHDRNNFDPFLSGIKKFGIFVPIYTCGRITNWILTDFFTSKSNYIIEDLLNDELVKGETILKLVSSDSNMTTDSNTLIKRRYEDVSSILSGTTILSDALATITKGSFTTSFLLSINAQDIIIYSMLWNQLTNSLSTWLSSTAAQYNAATAELSDKKASLDEYFRTNSDSIIQRDSNNFIKYQLEKLTQELRNVQGEQKTWNTINASWNSLKGMQDFIVSTLIAAYHVHTDAIKYEDFFKISFSIDDLHDLMSWSGKNAGSITNVEISLNRLDELLGRIRVAKSAQNVPKQIYKIAKEKGPWLCLDNLEVKAGNTTLTETPTLCLTDSIISVTGESRSGKSTFLKLVKGIEYSSASGNGNLIFYTQNGKVPKILMASQHYTIPPYSTLLEAITLKPMAEAKEKESFVRDIMSELDIDSNSHVATSLADLLYETKEDWNSYLTSGGVRKKLMAVWTILEKPDIAILDEIFAGIDRDAITHIQSVFKKYLSATKFLVVDHEAEAHADGFYECNLHVANKTMQIIGECAHDF